MGRPLFLMGTIPLYALGITAAWNDAEVIQVSLLVSGLFLVWMIQLMTHYNNEYCDLETDQATETHTRISGGSQALVRKLVPRNTARIAAAVCLMLAVVLAVIMIVTLRAEAWLLGFVGVASFFGWFYSAGPLKLESRGLGETDIVLISCFLLPSTSYFLQTSTLSPVLLGACVSPGLLTLALILTTEIADFKADNATGKKTLVVRLGTPRAKWLIIAALVLGWLTFTIFVIYLWPFWGWISASVSIILLVLIGLTMRSFFRENLTKLEVMGLAISLLMGYTTLCLVAAFLFK